MDKNLILKVFVIFVLYSCHGNSNGNSKSKYSGSKIPSFSILLPDSTSYLNTKNIPTTTPVILFYFDPNCEFSRSQLNVIIQHEEVLRNIKFYLITPEPFFYMKSFYDEFNLKKYTNIVVGYDSENFFHNHYKTIGYPYLAIYKKNGIFEGLYSGIVYSKTIIKATQ